MSSVHIPRVLTQRGKNQLEIERENFERSQTIGLNKAINQQETPTKEKHIRTAILGTHHEQGCKMFWSIVQKMQLQGHPIVCWKFLHVLHKILREGHPMAMKDSFRYRSMLVELGKLWGHLREGYGKIIAYYTKLMEQKLKFHEKNPDIPGSLFLAEGKLEQICENDVNIYYALCIDMLDYMDDILHLQERVFGSLDMSRANSMTAPGQCRLAPLILCIQDSCQLYDYIVRILFKLHSSLPPDTLDGHRARFNKQYKSLYKFYQTSANLQYYKNLIKVPRLPSEAPNFLQASELHSHVKPVATVPDPPPDPEPEEVDAQVDLLIDTQEEAAQQNGAPSPNYEELIRDRDMMIQALMRDIQDLKRQLSHVQNESSMIRESLENRIRDLEQEINELKQIAESTTQENETLKTTLKDGEKNVEAASRLTVMEKIAKGNEEKFKKMKDIYTKLREEHVSLLRKDADVKKQLAAEKNNKEELEAKLQTANQELQEIHVEKSKVEDTLKQNAESSSSRLAAEEEEKQKVIQEKEELTDKIQQLDESKTELQKCLDQCQIDIEGLHKELLETHGLKEAAEKKLEDLTTTLGAEQSEKANTAIELTNVKADLSKEQQAKAELESTLTSVKAELEQEQTSRKSTEETLENTKSEYEQFKTTKAEEIKSQTEQFEQQSTSASSEMAGVREELKNESEKKEELMKNLEEIKVELEKEKNERGETASALTVMMGKFEAENEAREKSDSAIEGLKKDLEQLKADKEKENKDLEEKHRQSQIQLLITATTEGEKIISEALAEADNPHHSTITCTAEYLIDRAKPVLTSLDQLRRSCDTYTTDQSDITDLIREICDFSHYTGDAIIMGFATSHSAPIDNVDTSSQLAEDCASVGNTSLELLGLLKQENTKTIPEVSERVKELINRIMSHAEELLPKIEDIEAEKMGDLVDDEMQQTSEAIKAAEKKIAEMLEASRKAQTGLQLEVNEKILDACTELMKSIQVLVVSAKQLQKEIVGQGRGTSTVKDFYKKHHRWTEGLLSSAKAVGWGANVLIDAADKVVKGEGKFEELVVCSQEIAASTTQLVVSSKVKADRTSEKLRELSKASKQVSQATGQVVATAKSGAKMIDEQDTLDFSKLTLHQAKRLEMESQVHLLELESKLEKERRKLSELRKTHYQLAGESEGWDESNS